MANSDDKQQIDDNVKDAEIVGEKNSSPAVAPIIWIALIVLLIVILASSGWLYTQIKNQAGAQSEVLSELQSGLEMQSNENKQLGLQLGSLKQDQQALADKLDEYMARDSLTSDELMKTWALQEIHYLLNVANQRALLAHDIDGARQALDMADKQLQALSDYRLHPLRALIAEEVMALDALADVDIEGMALKLQTAANRINTLRVKKGPEVADTSVAAIELEQGSEAGWKQALDGIWQQVRSLVVIRHDQTGEAAVLVPEQRYFLYQNLRLQLESARMALLNADNDSFQHSLKTAVNWLNSYFTGDERDAMLTMLQTLQQQDINVSIPDISGSLNWLEEYQR